VSELIKKVGGQTGWQILGKVISSISTLVFLSFITRHYGEEGTGVYTLAITYLGFFYLIADLALNAYALPYFEKDKKVWNNILGVRLVLSAFLIVFAFLFSLFFVSSQPIVFLAIFFGLFSIVGNAIFTTTNIAFQSKFRYDLSIIATSISSIVSLILIVSFIYWHAPLFLLTSAYTIGWILCAGISLFFVYRFVELKPFFSLTFIKKAFLSIWPVSLTLLLNVVYFRIDTFMLSYFRGIAEVGVYNLAYQFFSTALVLPTFIMNPLYPILIKYHQKSFSHFFSFILKMAIVMGGIGFMGSIVTYFLSPYVVLLVAGESGFGGSVEVLRILGFSFPAFFSSAVLMWSLVTLQLNKIMLGVYILGLLVNLILNYFFIPQHTYIAAAWITVLCEYLILFCQAIILLWYFNKQKT
jgi:O-antigen/teichoic acid export membrane protein